MGLANSACQAVFVGSHCDWKFGAEHILESFSMSSSPQLTPQMPGKKRWYQSSRQGNTQHPPIRAPSMKNSYNRFSSSQDCADGGSTAAWIEQGCNACYKTFNSSLDIPWTLNCNIHLVKLELCKDLNSFSEKLCDISFQQLVSCSVRHIGAMRSARIAILPCWGTSRGAYTAWTVSMSVCSSGAWVKQLLYFPF